MRVNMNVPDELIKRLDEYSKANYLTRSAVMCQACDQYLTAQEVKKLFKQMTETMKRLADKNEIDEQTKQEMEDFTRLAQMLAGSF